MLLLLGGKMLPRLEANHFQQAGPKHTVKINDAATQTEETTLRKAERFDVLTQECVESLKIVSTQRDGGVFFFSFVAVRRTN